MKSNLPSIILLAAGALALVSCEEPSRVVERPIQQYPIVHNIPGTLDNEGASGGQSLTPQSNHSLTQPQKPGPQQSNQQQAETPWETIPQKPQPKPVPAPVADEIKTAWPDPADPTIVRSPDDPNIKIRVTRPDGTVYPSGTILRDPVSGKKFKMP